MSQATQEIEIIDTMTHRATPLPVVKLLEWRKDFGFGKIESAVLALYVMVATIALRFHELWSDEAQAWILARDNSVWQLLRYRLHYEGAPGLWHLILHLFQILGGGYGAIGYLSVLFATAGVAVFLRWSPFPLVLRILLPFTFFIQYQYAVVARGYTLFPLLAFILCALFHARRHALWFALAAGLLANISLQGAVFSFFMMGLYLARGDRNHSFEPLASASRGPKFRAAALYLSLLAISALTALPAPDCHIGNGDQLASGFVYNLLLRFPGPLPQDQKLPIPPPVSVNDELSPLPPLPPPPAPPAISEPSLIHDPGAWAAWYTNRAEFDPQDHPQAQSVTQLLLHVVIEIFNLATGPVSTFKFLALAFLLTLTLWLILRNSLRFLIPWIANVAVGEALWIADHHTGLLFLSLLVALWLAADSSARRPFRASLRKLDPVLVVLLAAVAVLQISWTAVTLRHEIYQRYDPGPDTVAILRQHPNQRMAAFDFFAVDVQPYFSHNPFFNLPHSYWVWTGTANPNGAYLTTIEQRPDLVLFSTDLLEPGFMHNDWAPLSPINSETMDSDLSRNSIIRMLYAANYRETHRFCGSRFMRLSASYETCHLIFEPAPLTSRITPSRMPSDRTNSSKDR